MNNLKVIFHEVFSIIQYLIKFLSKELKRKE